MTKRKTLADVAAAAGVSKMTASRALRDDKDVSQSNIERVKQAAREIGYYGNQFASSLSSKHTDLIGVVVPSLSNIVFPQVMSGVTDALKDTVLQPVFGVTNYDPEATALLATGLRRFGYVGRNLDKDLRAAKRKQGFLNALRDHSLEFVNTIDGANLEDDVKAHSAVVCGRRMTADLLARQPNLDCIYFSNDDLAFGGLCHCMTVGINVPEDVALARFNGLGLIEGFPGKIATSRTARREIGEAAAQIILESLDQSTLEKGAKHILKPTISLGELVATKHEGT